MNSCNWYDLPCNLSALIAWLQEWFQKFLELYDKFKEWLELLPRKAWAGILDALASTMEAIPVPDAFSDAASALGNIPDSVMWFADMFAFGTCCGIVIAAYVIRFAIRRIPFIG